MSLYDRDYMRAGPAPFGERVRGMNAFHVVVFLNIAVFVFQWLFEIGWQTDPLTGENVMPLGGVSLHELAQWHAWTLFTYMFVHGSLGHLLLNMLLLWFAGKRVQQIYGPRRFLQIYFFSGIVGAAVEMLVVAYAYGNTTTSLIGASAACFGLLTAFAVAMPHEEMTILLAYVIPVSGRLWVITSILVGVNLLLGILALSNALPAWLSGDMSVAYFAHLGGAAAGWYFARTLGYDGTPAAQRFRRSDPHGMRRRRPELARARRQPVVDVDVEAARRQNPTNDPVVDIMRDEVDPILEKITDHGIHSLTDAERRILERASRQIVRRERRRGE